jgi:hypothetical protein
MADATTIAIHPSGQEDALMTGSCRWIASRRWGILTAVVIALAIVARIGLVAAGWPGTDSDDATMGLMAKHIVALGERPIFFYGQSYMGSLEAYAAALVFAFLGASEFALKCGLILLYACFMVIMYGFLVQITSRAWALVGEALLALGADEMLYHQLEAYGGYLETLLFGAALIAITCWLVRTQGNATLTRRRYLALAGWGLAAGLGLWSDVLVAPFVVLSAGALAFFCWPTVRRWGTVLALSCLLLGLSPWVIYLATPAPPAPRGLIQSGTALPASPAAGSEPSVIETATKQFLGMTLISLPNETGATTLCPLTPSEAWPQDHWTTPRIQQCIGFRAIWGGALLCLLALGLTLETRRPTPAPPRKRGLVHARPRGSRTEPRQVPWAGRARCHDRPLYVEFGVSLRALDLFALPHQREHRPANAAGESLGAYDGARDGGLGDGRSGLALAVENRRSARVGASRCARPERHSADRAGAGNRGNLPRN